ncbi:MAG: DMT family transporter [Chloroflexi bacterium]|nr:DMT family transporter [Chloroflexota bacterium]MCC6894468.1 DMT family transporter [Anaerolineae bacterium]
MPFIGELAAVGTSLCFSFGSTFFTMSGRVFGSIILNRGRLVVAVVLVMLMHLLFYGELIPMNAGIDRWAWMSLSGIVGLVLGDTFLLQAFVLIGPRLSMLMMAMAPVLGVVLAWVFLGETLALKEIIGIAVTLAGIFVVIGERRTDASNTDAAKPGDSRSYLIGLLCGLGGAAGQAGGLVLSRFGLVGDFPALSGSLIRLIAAMIVVWLIALFNRQAVATYRTLRQNPRAFMLVVGGTVLGPVLGVWLSLIAVQNTSVGVASTLSSLMPIFLIPISYFMFKERVTVQGIIGTVIAFVGMVLLFV